MMTVVTIFNAGCIEKVTFFVIILNNNVLCIFVSTVFFLKIFTDKVCTDTHTETDNGTYTANQITCADKSDYAEQQYINTYAAKNIAKDRETLDFIIIFNEIYDISDNVNKYAYRIGEQEQHIAH